MQNLHQIKKRISRDETKLRGSSSSNRNESGNLISRQNVMSALKKMHDGDYINRRYFVRLLMKSKELLHSIDPVYDVAYPNSDDPSSDPKVTVSINDHESTSVLATFDSTIMYGMCSRYLHLTFPFKKLLLNSYERLGGWRHSWTICNDAPYIPS